jgi:cobalt-zinc-cadmium efflux system protein
MTATCCDHDHHHHHHHHHHHAYDRAFAVGVTLNVGFVAVEVAYGVKAGSLALLSDAAHNLSDVLGLLLAWAATWLARQGSSRRRTYGFGRSTILASLVNAVVLLIGVGGIAWEALRRLGDPQPLAQDTVMWVAGLGIAVNAATAAMFMGGRKHDLNIRGAFLHMAADAAVSLGVVVAAWAIGATGWLWLDPAVSLAIVAVIAIGTWEMFRDSLDLALDAVPAGIDAAQVEAYLTALPGVAAIHDLHVWPLSTTSVALTAHLVMPAGAAGDRFLCDAATALQTRFGIDHATIQVETGDGDCRLTHVHRVRPLHPPPPATN